MRVRVSPLNIATGCFEAFGGLLGIGDLTQPFQVIPGDFKRVFDERREWVGHTRQTLLKLYRSFLLESGDVPSLTTPDAIRPVEEGISRLPIAFSAYWSMATLMAWTCG
jgi:hypothetical protein